jgi:hypothetical protein
VRALAAAIVLAASPSFAAEPVTFQLFPLRGLFFDKQEAGGKIDEDFRKSLVESDKTYFAERFRQRFPQAATTITEATRRRTYAVSVQVARASRYVVAKANGTADLYLPVTASTYFTNVMTGEVLYASTHTLYKTANVMPPEAAAGSATVSRLFAETFHEVVDALIDDAGKRFNPSVLSATVKKEWKGQVILAGGREQGISRDDTLLDAAGNEIRVVSAGPAYAVAKVELGKASEGAVFTKPTNRTLADIRKPRVLPIVEGGPSGFSEETLVQLFSDALGSKAPISLVPVNRTFAAVLAEVGSQTDLSQEKLRQRELPSHFIRLHVQEPVVYETPTNLSYKTLRVTQTVAYAEIVDQSGRVLFASLGRDRIEDEIINGQALSLAARKEIGIKNALLDLSNRIAADLKLESAALSVVAGGTMFTVQDDRGLLMPAAPVRVYQSAGKFDGLGEVWVPAWDAEVSSVTEGIASLQAGLPFTAGSKPPATGDRIFVEGVRVSKGARLRFAPCGEAERRGDVTIDDLNDLALNLLHAAYPAPFYSRGLASRLEPLVRGGTGFKADLRIKEPEVDYCVQPVYRVVPQPAKCSDTACAEVATLRLAYRVRGKVPDAKPVLAGREAAMTGTTLPRAASAVARTEALRADLVDEVIRLAPQAAGALAQEKL